MEITFVTNASEGLHAAALEQIGHLGGDGTLLFLQTRKKGVQRGVAGAKRIYGDDLVQVLIWTGFTYRAIIERSQRKLDELLQSGHVITDLTKAAHDHGDGGANILDSSAAIQEVQAWFSRVLADPKAKDDESETEEGPAVWEPLEVNGVKVPLCRVYRGTGDPQNPRAPIPGHIYVQGVKLGEKVVEAAANGRWKADSSHKTIAKDILRRWLPVGLYVQYVLDPNVTAHLVAGRAAASHTKAAGVPVDPEAIRTLFKIA